jgi:hypothetical protein
MFNPLTIGILLLFGLAITSADQALTPLVYKQIAPLIPRWVIELFAPYIAPYIQVIIYAHSLAWLIGIAMITKGGTKLSAFEYLFIVGANTITGATYLLAIKDIVESYFKSFFMPVLSTPAGAVTYFFLPFIILVILALISSYRKKWKRRKEEEKERRRFMELKEQIKREVVDELMKKINKEPKEENV